MKGFIFWPFFIWMVFSVMLSQAKTLTPALPSTALVPKPPTINAASYVLMDASSGIIITQKNMEDKRQPASLTKLMTLYLSFQAIKNGTITLDDKVRISTKAWRTGGSKMFIKVGDHVSVRQLIEGVIVDSGNDASVALAQYIGGSQISFVSMMNQQAKRLGMIHTHFSDPTGLPAPDHLSSAHDLALLAHAIINHFPKYYHFFSQKWLSYNSIRQPNRNRLLWRYVGSDGLKTGHTKAAGYCLIASAKQKDMRLISVVLGAPTDSARTNDSIALLRYGFRFYQDVKLYSGHSAIAHPRVWYGRSKTLAVGISNDWYVTIPRNQSAHLKVTANINRKLVAPISLAQQVGIITVAVNHKVLSKRPLIALQANPKGGFFSRGIDAIHYQFSHWFGDSNDNTVVLAGITNKTDTTKVARLSAKTASHH